jgi:ribosomal protein S6
MQKELQLYELLYLIDPSLTESDSEAKTSFYCDFLTSRGSQVMIQNRGKRSLSYKIRGCETGSYVQLIYLGNQKLRVSLDTEMRRDRFILRYMTIKVLPSILPSLS